MNDALEKPRRPLRRNRSIYQVHYGLLKEEREMARPLVMPTDSLEIQEYGKQVAGHRSSCDKRYLGLLQCNNGTILKPIIKPNQRREVDFYEELTSSQHPDLVEFRNYVPKYFGCRKFTYNGFEQEYIILEDVVERMTEPCIMDIKIGRQTWDHLATEEKIQREKTKYRLCKEEYGFCIPGFQVYRLSTGKLLKYNKDYGKRLHGTAVKDAIRNFLNGYCGPLCRALLLQLLTPLWTLQRWAARQRSLRLAACSVLLAYDAAKLRECCANQPFATTHPIARRNSIHSMHSVTGSNFSGQISAKGPIYKKVNSVPLTSINHKPTPLKKISSPWTEAFEKIKLNHSFEHNYEDKLCKIKMDYKATLEQLSGDAKGCNQWGVVRVIDFAHAFSSDEANAGEDFAAGVSGVVEVLEALLAETDEQTF